ncbi:hypothetical protein KV106_05835 [Variovorax sp. CY25R-8]|nr:hypothetical protein [Variovorax sp. CY25R-8]
MASLYLSMTEKLSAHWKANNNAYPQKFVLTPPQLEAYTESRIRCGADPKTISSETHMGVRIEISHSTPGIMVAADGTEIPLLGTSEA